MKFKAHDYQRQAIKFALDNKSCGLFLDMGLGKSVISLTYLYHLKYDYCERFKALVIAPKRVAENTWPDELVKWDHLKDFKMSLIIGSKANRIKALKEDADIYVVSRDNVKWLVEELKSKWFFDILIIDELSSFKNYSSQRFKALKKVTPFIKRVIGLTGTPAPNGYLDLWSQVYLLDRGERLGPTITKYRNTFFNTYFRGNYNEYDLRPGAKAEIDKRLSTLCVSMKSRDYIDLKEPTRINRYVNLEAKEEKLYKDLKRDYILSLDDETVTALNAAAVVNKLLQLSNGAVYNDDGDYQVIHSKKLDMLEELIEEAGENNVLVFYNFKSDKARILERFKEAKVLETDKDIRDWNDGKIKVLIAHPASTGHGLNIQKGGHIIAWFGLNWSLELYQQANARLQRQGQTEPVLIYHILCKDTVDEKVLDVIQGKNMRQEELLNELKVEMEGK